MRRRDLHSPGYPVIIVNIVFFHISYAFTPTDAIEIAILSGRGIV